MEGDREGGEGGGDEGRIMARGKGVGREGDLRIEEYNLVISIFSI